jgi:hypothetical protein
MRHRSKIRLSVAASFAAALASAYTQAAIVYVDGSLSATGNGMQWSTAYNNLQTAINAAVTGDQIWVMSHVDVPRDMHPYRDLQSTGVTIGPWAASSCGGAEGGRAPLCL